MRGYLDQRKATRYGGVAILMWSTLALLTVKTGNIPPFQLIACCLFIAGVIGLLWTLFRSDPSGFRGYSWKVWAHGVGGIFGYHLFYFIALRHGSPVKVSLIAYLWPLLIILFTQFLPGHTLRRSHIVGGLMGFSGAVIIVLSGDDPGMETEVVGFLSALVCALIWSGYSVTGHLLQHVPTRLVTGFCFLSALLGLLCHLLFEQTYWPSLVSEWLAVIGLGIGPVGLAFFFWDLGCKHGDLRVLGASSYFAPLLSTGLLLLFGLDNPRAQLILAALLIASGALSASKEWGVQKR